MVVKFQDAVNAARVAWLSNLTVADKQWPVRQLHGLYRLLLENRDEVLDILNEDSLRTPLFWESELASLVEDIAALILSVKSQAEPASIRDTHLGKFRTYSQPRGVLLILSTSQNPLRFALAPLAASIAARNAVVLSTTKEDRFFVLLEREAAKYIDTFVVQVVCVTIADVKAEKLDHIYIVAEDNDLQKYSELSRFRHVSWHSASGKFNVALVDGGFLSLPRVVQEISSNISNLTAIMIQSEHFQSLCDAFCQSAASEVHQEPKPSLDLPGCCHLTSAIYTMDWTLPNNSPSTYSVHPALRSAQRAGVVLFIKSSSLEHSLDVLRQPQDIGQAVLLNPTSKKVERYFRDWTRSSMVATKFISSSVPEVIDNYSGAALSYPITTFPVSLFAQNRLEAAEQVSFTGRSAEAIRKSYERRFPMSKKERSGKRIDFFVQVEYAVKAAGSVLAICGLVGAWYTSKVVRVKYFS